MLKFLFPTFTVDLIKESEVAISLFVIPKSKKFDINFFEVNIIFRDREQVCHPYTCSTVSLKGKYED